MIENRRAAILAQVVILAVALEIVLSLALTSGSVAFLCESLSTNTYSVFQFLTVS